MGCARRKTDGDVDGREDEKRPDPRAAHGAAREVVQDHVGPRRAHEAKDGSRRTEREQTWGYIFRWREVRVRAGWFVLVEAWVLFWGGGRFAIEHVGLFWCKPGFHFSM